MGKKLSTSKNQSDDVLNYNRVKLQTAYQESLKSASHEIAVSVQFLFCEFIHTYNLQSIKEQIPSELDVPVD